MTSISIDRHDNLTTGAFQRIATAVLSTDRSAVLTIARLGLGLVMLPHGLQKTIGAFGGDGYTASMGFFSSIGIPAFLGFLAIVAESAGALGLISGFMARIAAFGILANMVVAGAMHKSNGFFMNWLGNQKGEGFEYHILAAALAIIVIVGGAGSASIDRFLTRRNQH